MNNLSIYLKRANEFLLKEKEETEAGNRKSGESLFNNKGEIIKEYPPFAASFGATVLRSGLLPAVFLYAEKAGQGKNKAPLSELFYHTIADKDEREANNLKEHVLNMQQSQPDRIRQQLLDASIAAKLVMRTFVIEEKNSKS